MSTVDGIDLTISNATASDTAIVGGSIDISWTVANQGTEATTAFFWDDVIYFSTDEVFDDSDTFVTGESIFEQTPLAGGSNYTINQNVYISTFLETGNGYLLFVTDSSESQAETDNDNNVRAVPITLRPLDVDLVVSEAIASVNELGTLNLSWTVSNLGTDTAQRAFDAFFFSEDATFDPSVDRFITTSFDFPPIEGGGMETYSRILNESVPNERYLLVVTDYLDTQLETDESNNVAAALIISEVPDVDLVVSDIMAPSTARRGSEIEIAWTVANQGTEEAIANWDDQIYFSTDETFDPLTDRFIDSEFYLINCL